jgi:hypothetical protein
MVPSLKPYCPAVGAVIRRVIFVLVPDFKGHVDVFWCPHRVRVAVESGAVLRTHFSDDILPSHRLEDETFLVVGVLPPEYILCLITHSRILT